MRGGWGGEGAVWTMAVSRQSGGQHACNRGGAEKVELEGFGINVANIDASLVGKDRPPSAARGDHGIRPTPETLQYPNISRSCMGL